MASCSTVARIPCEPWYADRAHYVTVSRVVIAGLLVIGYILSVYTFEYLVVLVTLSGAGALQLLPAVLGVTFPSRSLVTASGVLAGIGCGLVALFLTLVVWPHPLTLHGGVWGLAVNGLVTWVVSQRSARPSAATVNRIHGAVEELVYGARPTEARARADDVVPETARTAGHV